MLLKASSAKARREVAPNCHPLCHPIYTTPGLDFTVYKASIDAPAARTVPLLGSVVLWRFRAEWQDISRHNAHSWTSRAERERTRHYPNAALAKRFLVGRAALRLVLSGMLDCSADKIELIDGVDGQPQLLWPRPLTRVCIHVAYAGIWVIVGLSATDLGIGTVLPVPDAIAKPTLTASLPDHLFPDVMTETQERARHASLSLLATNGSMDPQPIIVARYGAASVIATSTDQRCHVLDLPMPGKIAAAVAVTQLVNRVDAFGWI